MWRRRLAGFAVFAALIAGAGHDAGLAIDLFGGGGVRLDAKAVTISGRCVVGQPFVVEVSSPQAQTTPVRFRIEWMEPEGWKAVFVPANQGFATFDKPQRASLTFARPGAKIINVRVETADSWASETVRLPVDCGS